MVALFRLYLVRFLFFLFCFFFSLAMWIVNCFYLPRMKQKMKKQIFTHAENWQPKKTTKTMHIFVINTVYSDGNENWIPNDDLVAYYITGLFSFFFFCFFLHLCVATTTLLTFFWKCHVFRNVQKGERKINEI